MPHKISLTEQKIRALQPPAGGDLFVWDREVNGFGVRCYGSGRKVYVLQYRAGHGRAARQRRMPLGQFPSTSLSDARKAARIRSGEIAAGRDPQAERKENTRREDARLDKALDAYEVNLASRKVVNSRMILSLLRRELLRTVGKVDLAEIDRQVIAKQIDRFEAAGKSGAAQDLRAKATTFLNWAVGRGLIYANPLAGWRRDRATRAQVTGRTGRALSDAEIKALWQACEGASAPFGDFLRLLLLTGQRRGETADMRWQDVDLESGVWTVPPESAKNGREHRVPLPPLAIEIISRQRKWLNSPYVFAGRGGVRMSGWSKRMRSIVAAAEVAAFTLHDLRRTFRSGLSRLGVDADIAELMLNHARADLVERYDREPRWTERLSAAERWAEHIAGLIGTAPDRGDVVDLAARRSAVGGANP